MYPNPNNIPNPNSGEGQDSNITSGQDLPLNFCDLNTTQVVNMTSDEYIAYLVNGYVRAEQIAKRNQHRPCFNNILDLCRCIRTDVVKPHLTAANIYFQGMPCVTKDFVFAFLRLTEAWCILKRYFGCQKTYLGKVEHEISPEFRTVYSEWEMSTKRLMHSLINTFFKLDEAGSRKSPFEDFTVNESATPLPPSFSQVIPPEETETGDSETKTKQYLKSGTYIVPLKKSQEPSVEVIDNEVPKRKLKDSHKHFSEVDVFLQNSTGSGSLNFAGSNVPVTTRKYSSSNSSQENNEDILLKTYFPPEGFNERHPLFKRTTSSSWESRKGQLTDYTIRTIHKIFADLQRTDFAAHVTNFLDFNICTDTEINNPTNMNTIAKKLNKNYYMYLSEFVHDIRHMIIYPNPYCKDSKYMKHLELFKSTFNDLLKEEFPDVDFQYVTGEPKESLGLFSLNMNDITETDVNAGV